MPPSPASPRYGLWLVGARGGVAVSTLAGLFALREGLTDDVGLVSEAPLFAHLDLPRWSDFLVGGHDIRTASLAGELERLHRDSRVIDPALVAACRPWLDSLEPRLRPGVLWRTGERIASLADDSVRAAADQAGSPREAWERIKADLADFRRTHDLAAVVVLNLASTEPPPADAAAWPAAWEPFAARLADADFAVPASTLYAAAALDLGMPYVNFTPSLGASLPALEDLARRRGVCHAGQDAKTGETLLKSVLAPMFAARRLQVLSWVGHNIFGNLDGKVLDDPRNKAAKLASKDRAVVENLGYAPQTLISIEHVASLGDWKTAWDHIHFRGFLGTPMALQFTWQGCDSLLAAPLALDLARFALAAHARGEIGPLQFLASFFKSPLGGAPPAFADQVALLEDWGREIPMTKSQ